MQLKLPPAGYGLMKHLLIGLAAILPAWGAAAAQDAQAQTPQVQDAPAQDAPAQENRDLRVRVGLGAQVEPRYVGSDNSKVGPLFHVDIAHGTKEFRFSAPDDGPAIALRSAHGLSFGLAGNIERKRKASDVGAPVGDVKRTFEVGAFAQYEWQDSLRIRGQLLKGINGHDGVVGEISADKIWRDGDRYVFSLGPRVLFADGRYERAYFGVTPAVSLVTGLPAYRPGSGVYAIAGAAGLTYALSDQWGLFGFARYERLVGDAARSPIVRQLGSRNQLSAGAGINYTFIIHRAPKQ